MKTHTPHTPAPALAEHTFFVMPASIRIHDVDPVCILDGDGDTLATVNAPNKTKWHDPQAVATRIVACVNACAGIADPGAVPELMAALRELMTGHSMAGEAQARAAIAKALGGEGGAK